MTAVRVLSGHRFGMDPVPIQQGAARVRDSHVPTSPRSPASTVTCTINAAVAAGAQDYLVELGCWPI